jgi:uncharacterized protein YbjT (DUF2867 family)
MILITGASGNVGKEVVNQIVQTGAKVRATFQSSGKTAPPGVEIAIVDFNEPATLRAALDQVDRVFLVGPPTAQLPSLEKKAIDVIARSNVRQVVKLSAMGGRDALFTRQHAESEDYIMSSGVPYTFLRPNGFMQNAINFSSATIGTQNTFYGSEGEGRVSQIDIRDVAAVAVKTLTEDDHLGKAYTLTGPEALTNAEIAQILSNVLGREIRYVNLPPAELKKAMLSAGTPEWSADAILDLQRLYREGKAAAVTQDVEQVLGRKPVSFAKFVSDHRDAFKVREKASTTGTR